MSQRTPTRTRVAHFVCASTQPCAMYVPETYEPDKPAPLVVLLHGKGVSESAELAEPTFRGLAAETNAIVIAPFARGDDICSAATDVYEAVDAIEATFAI